MTVENAAFLSILAIGMYYVGKGLWIDISTLLGWREYKAPRGRIWLRNFNKLREAQRKNA